MIFLTFVVQANMEDMGTDNFHPWSLARAFAAAEVDEVSDQKLFYINTFNPDGISHSYHLNQSISFFLFKT